MQDSTCSSAANKENKECAIDKWNAFKVTATYLNNKDPDFVQLTTMLKVCEYDIAMALAGTPTKPPTTIMKEISSVLARMA